MNSKRTDPSTPSYSGGGARMRALVLHPKPRTAADGRGGPGRSAESRLAEAVGLAEAIALDVVAAEIVPVPRISAATYIGAGRLSAFADLVNAEELDVAIFDCPLSPVQQRNLERTLGIKVVDRTGLILEIFGERARTREGVLQVELAHLAYQRGRLVRSWTHLERQRGGYGFLGGPGERQIEADRRAVDERIGRIRASLGRVRKTRGLHRTERKKTPVPVVALVGYTNAGKSTLFNRISKAEVHAADQLFATLDPTMRGVHLPSGRRIILSDTVGFISDLPTELVAAFRATLEEVIAADVILHVIDIADPDQAANRDAVLQVLESLGIDCRITPIIDCYNKCDALDEVALETLRRQATRADSPQPVLVSALKGQGIDALLAALDAIFRQGETEFLITLPPAAGEGLAWLHAHGEVLGSEGDDSGNRVRVRLSSAAQGRFAKYFPEARIAKAPTV